MPPTPMNPPSSQPSVLPLSSDADLEHDLDLNVSSPQSDPKDSNTIIGSGLTPPTPPSFASTPQTGNASAGVDLSDSDSPEDVLKALEMTMNKGEPSNKAEPSSASSPNVSQKPTVLFSGTLPPAEGDSMSTPPTLNVSNPSPAFPPAPPSPTPNPAPTPLSPQAPPTSPALPSRPPAPPSPIAFTPPVPQPPQSPEPPAFPPSTAPRPATPPFPPPASTAGLPKPLHPVQTTPTTPSTVPQIPPRPSQPQIASQAVLPKGLGSPPSAVPPAVPPRATGSPPPAVAGKPTGSVADQPKLIDTSKVKQSPLRFLPFILGLLVVLGAGIFLLGRFLNIGPFAPPAQVEPPRSTGGSGTTGSGGAGGTTGGSATTPFPTQKTTLTYWGLWETESVMADTIAKFEASNPTIDVQYQQQSATQYRERLQDALQKGTGPDIFRFHVSWVPMLKSQLTAVPSSVISPQVVATEYFPVVQSSLVQNGALLGVPLMYDGLALFYNTKMLQTATITPPTTWTELEAAAKTLTISTNGVMSRAGAALGNTSNVDHFSDILGLLILQNGGDPSKPTDPRTQEAVQFYTNYFTTAKVWDASLPASTQAFATEKVAMILAPSWRAFEIRAANPTLEFGIAPSPQLPGSNTTWASFWVEGVAKSSKNQEAAWKFLSFLTQQDSLESFANQAATKTPRLFGPIFPTRTMAATLAADPYTGAFVADAAGAKSWYLSSRTFDNGINDRIIKYYEDMVNALLTGSSEVATLAQTAELGVTQVLQQFGVTTTSVLAPSAAQTSPL